MNEQINWEGTFRVYDNPGYTLDYLRSASHAGPLAEIPGVTLTAEVNNLLMAPQKLLMAQSVFPNIDKLVITTQTDAPSDDETEWAGELYRTVAADEFYRSASTNPYQIGWNITGTSANGTWGSFLLITAGGELINRALAGITKTSGTAKIVEFVGRVT